MAGSAVPRRGFEKQNGSAFNFALGFMAGIASDVRMSTFQGKTGLRFVVEEGRPPFTSGVTLHASRLQFAFHKLTRMDVLVATIALSGCRPEIDILHRQLKVGWLVASHTWNSTMASC